MIMMIKPYCHVSNVMLEMYAAVPDIILFNPRIVFNFYIFLHELKSKLPVYLLTSSVCPHIELY